ncbi:MAG: hypothetical protein Q8S31_09915 [Alphaproteobacteria bacterium]|nr:hypothetical protein [Alphaproteobacteria bacterium]
MFKIRTPSRELPFLFKPTLFPDYTSINLKDLCMSTQAKLKKTQTQA